jgi:hypothetical protein
VLHLGSMSTIYPNSKPRTYLVTEMRDVDHNRLQRTLANPKLAHLEDCVSRNDVGCLDEFNRANRTDLGLYQ